MADTLLRVCHGVLWDVHGVILKYRTRSRGRKTSELRREHWLNFVFHVLRGGGASINSTVSALDFWRKRMYFEINLPRNRRTDKGMQIISERDFQLSVNIALMGYLAPEFVKELPDQEKVRLARQIWRKRRTDPHKFMFDPGMRRLVRWLEASCIYLCLVTAQDRKRAVELLNKCRIPWSFFTRLYTSGDLGLPKSHPAFWKTVQEKLSVPADSVVCIEDNLAMGRNAIKAGMPLILCDFDGETKRFIRDDLGGELAGAPLLEVGDTIPITGPFVICARNPGQIKRVFQSMKLVPYQKERR